MIIFRKLLLIFLFSVYSLDSLPFFNIGVYRPFWVVPVLLLIPLLSWKYIYKRGFIITLIVSLYGLFFGFVFSEVSLKSTTIALLLCIAIPYLQAAISWLALRYASSFEEFCDEILPKYLLLGSIIPSIAGLIYIASSDIGRVVEGIFSFRVYLDRLQLVSGEPSWAAKYLLIWILCSIYVFKKYARLLLIVWFVILLVYTRSSLGFILIAIFLLYKYKYDFIKKLPLTIPLLIISYFIFVNLDFGSYTERRFDNISSLLSGGFDYLVYSDDRSMLIRLLSPTVGFVGFFESFGFGVGIDGTNILFDQLIGKIFYLFSINMDIYYFIDGGVSAKNLISKVIGEFGILGLFMSIMFIREAIYGRGFLRDFNFLVFLICLNSDGYLFFPLVLFISLSMSRRQYDKHARRINSQHNNANI